MTTEAYHPAAQRMIEDMNARKLCAEEHRGGHILSCKRVRGVSESDRLMRHN